MDFRTRSVAALGGALASAVAITTLGVGGVSSAHAATAAAGTTSTASVASPTAGAASASTGVGAAARAASGRIHWKKCADIPGAQCGMLAVPLNPKKPHGQKIKIAVSRVLHTKTPYRGAIFTNPGGPGGSGLGLSTLGQYVPDGVGLTYDWYGIDPRGVGSSKPALTCNGRYFGTDRPDYKPHTRALMAFWRHKTAGYAKACGNAKAKRLLPYMRTVDNVADFEQLRQAIGAKKITYYGFSYGTYIGEVYATLHPKSLKAMVLDGVIDPTRVFYKSNLDQDKAFQVTIKKFFAWLAEYHTTYHLGTTEKQVYATYTKLRAKLVKHPADKGRVGPDELDDALLPAGYYNLTWLDVAKAFAALANHGKGAGILAGYRSGNPSGKGADNGYAVYAATECTDARWPHTFSPYVRDNRRTAKKAQFYTWANGWFNQPCQTWSVPDHQAVKVSGKKLKAPVLLTAEQYDAATPFPGALKTRKLFPTSRVVEGVGGTSHAVTLYGVACTDDSIADLLRTGKLPARVKGNRADRRCPGLPAPSPTTAQPQASARMSLLRPLSPLW